MFLNSKLRDPSPWPINLLLFAPPHSKSLSGVSQETSKTPQDRPDSSCPTLSLLSPPFSSCFCLRKSKRDYLKTQGGGRGKGGRAWALDEQGRPEGWEPSKWTCRCLSRSPGPGKYIGKKDDQRMPAAGVRAGGTHCD